MRRTGDDTTGVALVQQVRQLHSTVGALLPPLVKIPAAPAELTAERRAATVDLQFIVPATNTDGSRPANIERVDVYGFTGAPTLTEDEIVKLGTKVASVAVKAPRNPDATVDPDEPDDDADPPEGKGLDQGAVARVTEELSEQALVTVHPVKSAKAKPAAKKKAPAAKKAALIPREPFRDNWAYLHAMLRLIRANSRGEYRDIPHDALLSIIAAISYLVDPFDLIPDEIPFLGFLDDATVIAFTVEKTKQPLDDFMAWEISALAGTAFGP
jgi:uncharacterized membrane protein YkvA (DUF1232 family)